MPLSGLSLTQGSGTAHEMAALDVNSCHCLREELCFLNRLSILSQFTAGLLPWCFTCITWLFLAMFLHPQSRFLPLRIISSPVMVREKHRDPKMRCIGSPLSPHLNLTDIKKIQPRSYEIVPPQKEEVRNQHFFKLVWSFLGIQEWGSPTKLNF